MNCFSAVIFDLDGTLVDSAEGILASLAAAFQLNQMQPVRALTAEVIGPPLLPTLKFLSGVEDPLLLTKLADDFMGHYDSEGYRNTRAYSGADELLVGLRATGLRLFIATNKRHIPTERILDLLGWHHLFEASVSLDTPQLPVTTKGALLRYLLGRFALSATTTLYAGDRYEDEVAAAQADLAFFRAIWGYESNNATPSPLCGNMAALAALLHIDQSAIAKH